MKCRILAVFLAGFVLLLPLSASPSPPPSSSGVWLSDEEAAAMQAAMEAADKALAQSSDKIATQEKSLKRLYWLCGALVLVLAVDATAEIIQAIKR